MSTHNAFNFATGGGVSSGSDDDSEETSDTGGLTDGWSSGYISGSSDSGSSDSGSSDSGSSDSEDSEETSDTGGVTDGWSSGYIPGWSDSGSDDSGSSDSGSSDSGSDDSGSDSGNTVDPWETEDPYNQRDDGGDSGGSSDSGSEPETGGPDQRPEPGDPDWPQADVILKGSLSAVENRNPGETIYPSANIRGDGPTGDTGTETVTVNVPGTTVSAQKTISRNGGRNQPANFGAAGSLSSPGTYTMEMRVGDRVLDTHTIYVGDTGEFVNTSTPASEVVPSAEETDQSEGGPTGTPSTDPAPDPDPDPSGSDGVDTVAHTMEAPSDGSPATQNDGAGTGQGGDSNTMMIAVLAIAALVVLGGGLQ
jgi:hypothetical protein